MKRIDFEAHFMPESLCAALKARDTEPLMTADDVMIFGPDCVLPYGVMGAALKEVAAERVSTMDKAGVDIQIVSSVGGLELMPEGQAVKLAREVNDELYSAIKACPDRFRGYATLAPQNIEAAVEELDRCVSQLGFVAWNTFSNYGADALDDPRYFPILQKAADLGVFVYLHPTMPTIDRLHGFGRQLVASGLGFGIDVMITLTRMILGGVFDRLPDLKVVLGHLGEGFPFVMDRMRSRGSRESLLPAVNELQPREYFARNIWASTSGNYSKAAFNCTLEAFGAGHILLGSDYPMEPLHHATEFLDGLDITPGDREKISYGNAEDLFGIL